MADSHDTRIASAIPLSPTRRALVAGLAVAPLAGVPAVSGAISAGPMSDALAQAIERHRAALAAEEAAYGPEDLPEHLSNAESEALADLVGTPCANDAELLKKMRYLLAYEKKHAPDQEFELSLDGSVVIALDLHFNPEALA